MSKEINTKLVETIDKFYIDIIDDFKEAEAFIINESKFTSIFKKKNYDRNIKKLRDCKKKCLALPAKNLGINKSDKLENDVFKNLERTRYAFNALCDAYVQLQLSLQKKEHGEKTSYKEYRALYTRMMTCRNDLNAQLHELDIAYTDYTYDEDAIPYEFL